MQAVIPFPFVLPWFGEIFIPPTGTVVLPPIYVDPSGIYTLYADWDGDWDHAPNGPDMDDPNSNPLGPDWEIEPGSKQDKTGKHRYFYNKKTGERVRWDADDKHWHRLNPDRYDRKHPYLDSRGRPVKNKDPAGHIKPNPQRVFVYYIPMS